MSEKSFTNNIQYVTEKEFMKLTYEKREKEEQVLHPMIIRDYAKSWPVIYEGKSFSDIANSNSNNECIVPLEMGGNYMSPSFKRIFVEFREFASFLDLNERNIEVNDTHEHFYLAQHDLSNPELKFLNDHIIEPAGLIKHIGKGMIQNSNIWMGLKGVSSPCHFDPFHNIKVQVKGEKRIVLYPPVVAKYLYLATGTLQNNSTTVPNGDPSDENLYEVYPLLKEANKHKVETILQPGDALYIPYKYFHFVYSKTNTLSVNWWFL